MGACNGRCKCHARQWRALEQAAGLPVPKRGHPPFFETDPVKFQRKLKEHYEAEELAEPDKPPSLRRVAKRFAWGWRTLKATMIRLGVPWPGPDNPFRGPRLHGRSNGRATTKATLTRRQYVPSAYRAA